jgi:hypothetical protein
MSSAERGEIRDAYRQIYRSSLCHADVVKDLSQSATPAGRRLADFFAAPSRRGITKESRRNGKKGREARAAATERDARESSIDERAHSNFATERPLSRNDE